MKVRYALKVVVLRNLVKVLQIISNLAGKMEPYFTGKKDLIA